MIHFTQIAVLLAIGRSINREVLQEEKNMEEKKKITKEELAEMKRLSKEHLKEVAGGDTVEEWIGHCPECGGQLYKSTCGNIWEIYCGACLEIIDCNYIL